MARIETLEQRRQIREEISQELADQIKDLAQHCADFMCVLEYDQIPYANNRLRDVVDDLTKLNRDIENQDIPWNRWQER